MQRLPKTVLVRAAMSCLASVRKYEFGGRPNRVLSVAADALGEWRAVLCSPLVPHHVVPVRISMRPNQTGK